MTTLMALSQYLQKDYYVVSDKTIVLMIDEVDSVANNQVL